MRGEERGEEEGEEEGRKGGTEGYGGETKQEGRKGEGIKRREK